MIYIDYPVGGSLAQDNPYYVQRQADIELVQALQDQQFCYVFNSRQMGKSSLLVQARYRLQQHGYRCCTVDLTSIGGQTATPPQWYKGVAFELWRGFELRGQLNFRDWWQNVADLPLPQRLQQFISDIVLALLGPQPLVIFIDEIDSILSLPFPVDDFFALIRFCYNQRSLDARYRQLTFALAGVATPSDLVQDKRQTPFNIGRAIELGGFDYRSAWPLERGLEAVVNTPEPILQSILSWTGGQPFLTQKLCQLTVRRAVASAQGWLELPAGAAPHWVADLVHRHILQDWESQDEPEHLRTIRDRLLHGGPRSGRLLGIYQQLLQGEWIQPNDSREQAELMLTGLTVRQQGQLQLKNPIYGQVFDPTWVATQLSALRPYAESFAAWEASGRADPSRLLRGQALSDARQWAQGKSLSDGDYQYLAASQEYNRREIQQALEAEKLTEVEARLAEEQRRRQQERRNARLQRWLLAAVSLILLATLGLGLTLRQQYQAAVQREQAARISEIQALVSSAEGLFASDRKLDALVAALQAQSKRQALSQVPADL